MSDVLSSSSVGDSSHLDELDEMAFPAVGMLGVPPLPDEQFTMNLAVNEIKYFYAVYEFTG